MDSPGAFLCGGLIVVTLLGAIWMLAYRVGFSEGRLSVPLRLITSLVDHKINCLHERPDRVALDMHLLLDLPQHESRRLVARAAGEQHPEPGLSPSMPH
jgi:hypothetical protein